MVTVRKRKMARSSVRKNTRKLKDKRLNVIVAPHPIIAANWDKSLTLQQNYKRLGLSAKSGIRAGGEEREVLTFTQIKARRDAQKAKITPADIEQTEDPTEIPEGEARIIRDEETNEIIRVIHGTKKVQAVELDEGEDKPDVIAQLQVEAERYSKIKKDLAQSVREVAWLKDLYDRHGDDYEKMKWDMKLNPMQQSAGDLKRRITKWKKSINME